MRVYSHGRLSRDCRACQVTESVVGVAEEGVRVVGGSGCGWGC